MLPLPITALAHLLLGHLLLTTAIAGRLPDVCDNYEPLYASIHRDLDIYKRNAGISPNLIYRTMVLHSAGYREKGLAVAVYRGKVYIISNTRSISLKRFGHHVALWVAYIKVLLDLEEKYGSYLPDVEFVWHTIDRPIRLVNTTPGGENFPVFRFCKSVVHPDILVPNFHFYMKPYQREFLDRIPHFNAEVPWAQRRPIVFARFSGYVRYVHPGDPSAQRLGAGGRQLCEVKGTTTSICPVREHLHNWAANYTSPLRSLKEVYGVSLSYSDDLDISKDQHLPMKDHMEYRYLLHVDGQGLSSKLETLLTLGSLVMKEESGYMAFYHHLLKPFEHFVPVWRAGTGPETILDALAWARTHDAEAQRIAAAGQALTAKYLSSEARACFWLKLLEEYGNTLSYKPVEFRNLTFGPDGWVSEGKWRYIKPARVFLKEERKGKWGPRCCWGLALDVGGDCTSDWAAVAMQSGTHTAVASTARCARERKTMSMSAAAVKRQANINAVRHEVPVASSSPFGAGCGGAASRREASHWSALRSRLFPALRVTLLPFTAACLAAAAGAQGQFQRPPDVAGLHGSHLPPRAPFATHGSIVTDSTAVPTDVRTARQMLESRGFVHPGLQPGAAWGALPAASPGGSGEMHAMFEYLLLFPA
ncbi:hypothetical protein VOLCADRAFT_89378 [Volvox carteri f. nagariensis]|uniref:Glycosyl transferase CAP10 domain-containing protein n=1 Tax=Volvox carteri f. nagariensis TaxID=3068 RepID=D8TRJ6_VOLCA|nr:uncharacterized protein VOLCADRAFT_89378 [Volvox carteri f. nagariensis]EFJ49904.1 hypothetical protein VOLCADRAFT_89378 [Volvox carteri f. nagariensis]|eukprot:XP_002948969.1 hypothetical protein VOLCADRAFT_89378 [Volvox carteri f. nagariensis]